jgi:hypothetical protein
VLIWSQNITFFQDKGVDIMHKRLLSTEPICNLDDAIQVFPLALIVLAKFISITYPQLLHNLKHGTRVAFVCLLWGITFLDKHSNPNGIARKLKHICHDRMQNLRKDPCLTATTVMLELFQQALTLMTTAPYHQTMLILDDVLIPKPFAKFIQGAYWDHDHALDIPSFGIRVVVLLYSNGTLAIPVAFLIWHKKQNPMPDFAPRRYRSKNDLARILVYLVYRKGLRFCVLTFDAWYAKEENLILFNRLGILWVTALAPNRWIRLPLETPRKNPRGKPTTHEKLRCEDLSARYPRRGQYSNYPALGFRAKAFSIELTPKVRSLKLVVVKDFIRSQAFQKEVELNNIASNADLTKTKKKPKGRHPHKYLLTNSLDASVAWIIRCYQTRWEIEWAFRESKQHFALGACSAVRFEAVTQHISLCFLGFVSLQQLHVNAKASAKGDPYGVKDNRTLGEYRRELQQLYQFRTHEFVYLVNLSEQCGPADHILADIFSKNVLSNEEHQAKYDNLLDNAKEDKSMSYLDMITAA